MTVGEGWRIGRENPPASGELAYPAQEGAQVTENELTIFIGQSASNSLAKPKALAYAGEYRRGVLPHVDWSVSAVYESAPRIIRRSRAATQLWLVNPLFDNQITVGIGLGPYVFLDHRKTENINDKDPAAVAPLVSFTISVRLSEKCTVRMVFDRETSSNNRKADIVLLGLGCCWPR